MPGRDARETHSPAEPSTAAVRRAGRRPAVAPFGDRGRTQVGRHQVRTAEEMSPSWRSAVAAPPRGSIGPAHGGWLIRPRRRPRSARRPRPARSQPQAPGVQVRSPLRGCGSPIGRTRTYRSFSRVTSRRPRGAARRSAPSCSITTMSAVSRVAARPLQGIARTRGRRRDEPTDEPVGRRRDDRRDRDRGPEPGHRDLAADPLRPGGDVRRPPPRSTMATPTPGSARVSSRETADGVTCSAVAAAGTPPVRSIAVRTTNRRGSSRILRGRHAVERN
jgi:hypothetical protein